MIDEHVEKIAEQDEIDDDSQVFENESEDSDESQFVDKKDLEIEIGFKTCMVKLDHNTGSDDFMQFLHLIDECDDNDENLVGDLKQLI